MAYVYYFMYGTEMLSQETAARIAKEWRLKAADYYCDWCEKSLTSKTKCDGTDGPHPWRMHFLAMGNPLGDAGDFARHVKVAEQMSLVPVEPTITRRSKPERTAAGRNNVLLFKLLKKGAPDVRRGRPPKP
jgi:hypothetical protein